MKYIRNLILLLPPALAVFQVCGCWKAENPSGFRHTGRQVIYSDSDAGFGTFIKDLVEAHAGNESVQNRMRNLVIPNSSTWFITLFGPTTGPILDFQYRHQLRWQFARLYYYLPIYAHGQQRLVHTQHCDKSDLSPFVGNSSLIPFAEVPLKIYSASIATQEEGPWLKVGSFAYVDGNFRFMGSLPIQPDWGAFQVYDTPFEN